MWSETLRRRYGKVTVRRPALWWFTSSVSICYTLQLHAVHLQHSLNPSVLYVSLFRFSQQDVWPYWKRNPGATPSLQLVVVKPIGLRSSHSICHFFWYCVFRSRPLPAPSLTPLIVLRLPKQQVIFEAERRGRVPHTHSPAFGKQHYYYVCKYGSRQRTQNPGSKVRGFFKQSLLGIKPKTNRLEPLLCPAVGLSHVLMWRSDGFDLEDERQGRAPWLQNNHDTSYKFWSLMGT